MPVIGFLGRSSPKLFTNLLRAFRQGLGEVGFVEGRNVTIEYRWAWGQNDRLPELAGDLVRRQVSVIAASNTSGTLAAKHATHDNPDRLRDWDRPDQGRSCCQLEPSGGNVTGNTTQAGELGPKRLELLHELLPATKVIAVLVNPNNPMVTAPQLQDLPVAARTLGIELRILNPNSEAMRIMISACRLVIARGSNYRVLGRPRIKLPGIPTCRRAKAHARTGLPMRLRLAGVKPNSTQCAS